jgi:glycosyltransferase involved in cell wall biosynthesis
LLDEQGWNLEIGYVEPTFSGLSMGIGRIIRQARRVDVINSVSNPPHLQVAGAIAAGTTGTPWLAEFRDPLVENPDVAEGSLSKRLRRQIERYILTHAERVVWYDGIQLPEDYFPTTYPNVDPAIYKQLPPIGFERAAFESVDAMDTDTFTITYAGSFYDGWIEPYTFLEGLGAYVETTGDDDVEARFYGDWSEEYTAAAADVGVSNHVQSYPFVPHEEIVSVMKGSDAVLYIGGSDSRNRRNLPSKLYDYIGARRPILALVDSSFRVANVITENGFGLVADPDDPSEVADALRRIQSGTFAYTPSEEDVKDFTRNHSAEAYLTVLNELLEE